MVPPSGQVPVSAPLSVPYTTIVLSATPSSSRRFNKPPTWRGAINRSLIAVVFFVALLVLLFKQPAQQVLSLAAVLLVLYVPLSYYTDLWLYRRRQAKLVKARAEAGKPKKNA